MNIVKLNINNHSKDSFNYTPSGNHRIIATTAENLNVTNLNKAIRNLRLGEGLNKEEVGYVNLKNHKTRAANDAFSAKVAAWAQAKGFDAVIWNDRKFMSSRDTNLGTVRPMDLFRNQNRRPDGRLNRKPRGEIDINRHEHVDPIDVRHRLDKNRKIAEEANQPVLSGFESFWNELTASKVKERNAVLSKNDAAKSELVDGLNGVGVAHMKSDRRPTQEDEHVASKFFIHVNGTPKEVKIAGILDGHGGHACSKFVADNLQRKFEEILPLYLEKYQKAGEDVAIYNALKIAFVDLNNAFHGLSGTTACIAMYFNDHLWIANVGDSRAVLCQNGHATTLSQDADPKIGRFENGVKKRGGVVIGNRVQGQLATARAVGDYEIKGVNSRPKIVDLDSIQLKEIIKKGGNPSLVIACDGLWDVASSDQVADTMQNLKGSPADKAEFLIQNAYASGSNDNISAVVIDLQKFLKSPVLSTPTNSSAKEEEEEEAPIVESSSRNAATSHLNVDYDSLSIPDKMNFLIENAPDYNSSLTADFSLRDKLPQSKTPKHLWPTPNPGTGFGKWGPGAKQYPEVNPPSWVQDPLQWKRDRIVAVGKKYLGLPYKHHHIPGMKGIDCSNFTSWIYNYGLGVKKFTSGIGPQAEKAGSRLNSNDPLQPGDLLFIKGFGPKKDQIIHVVMYIDKNTILDSTTGGTNNVALRPFKGWYKSHFSHARRIIK